MAVLDWLKQVVGGGDPADSTLGRLGVPVMPESEDYSPPRLMTGGALGEAGQPAGWSMHDYALQHLQDVISGKVAYQGVLGPGYQGDNRALDIASGFMGAIKPIRAYHGSPHSFDRFDISKIGTGEGAQAYGHGLYFAEAEDVARGYRDTLAGKAPLREYGSQPLETNRDWYNLIDKVEPQDWRLARIIDAAGKQGGVRSALDTFEPHTRNASDGPLWSAAIERFKEGVGPAAKGHMYEVSLHADPKAFLDWDRPVSGQPKIDDALYDVLERAGIDKMQTNYLLNNKTGEEVYRQLQQKLRPTTLTEIARSGGEGSPALASRSLNEAGIPGIRYLDQGSRGAGGGTSNYAIFDPSIIEILRKYGILPPAVATGGLLATQGEPPI